MRLLTHYMFTIEITSSIAVLAGMIPNPDGPAIDLPAKYYVAAAAILLLSFIVNTAIDRLGHTWRSYNGKTIPVRTPNTHGVNNAAKIGLIAGAGAALLAAAQGNPLYAVPLFIMGFVSPYTHLFLDAFTEAGVYNSRGQRVAFAHFKYDNPAVNLGAVLLGAFVTYAAYTAVFG